MFAQGICSLKLLFLQIHTTSFVHCMNISARVKYKILCTHVFFSRIYGEVVAVTESPLKVCLC